jgi:hypothetical protein
MKQIEVTDADVKQAIAVFQLMQEAQFKIKGDTMQMAAGAQRWMAEMVKRLREAKEPEAAPVQEEPKKGRK